MKKNLIVTFTVVTAISLGILTGCGAYQHASADPLTNPTQIEQMVEDEHQDTEASGDVSENGNQEATQETSSGQQELQNQDEDPIENNDNKPNTETTDATPSTEQAHVHTWVTETRYRTVHHDAVTHTEQVTVIDQAAWDETVTTYTSEPQVVHHDAETRTETSYCETCCDCGASFTDHGAAIAHLRDCDHMSGLVSDSTEVTVVVRDAWDETVYVQVPHTETVHHDAITHVETKTVVDKEAYDEQIPYTVEVCSECGKEK